MFFKALVLAFCVLSITSQMTDACKKKKEKETASMPADAAAGGSEAIVAAKKFNPASFAAKKMNAPPTPPMPARPTGYE